MIMHINTYTDIPNYVWWIIGGFALFILLVLTFVLVKINQRKKEKKGRESTYNTLLEALGGKGNIEHFEIKMSRVNLTFVDASIVNEEALKNAGVSRIIKMEKKWILLLGKSDAERFSSYLK